MLSAIDDESIQKISDRAASPGLWTHTGRPAKGQRAQAKARRRERRLVRAAKRTRMERFTLSAQSPVSALNRKFKAVPPAVETWWKYAVGSQADFHGDVWGFGKHLHDGMRRDVAARWPKLEWGHAVSEWAPTAADLPGGQRIFVGVAPMTGTEVQYRAFMQHPDTVWVSRCHDPLQVVWETMKVAELRGLIEAGTAGETPHWHGPKRT